MRPISLSILLVCAAAGARAAQGPAPAPRSAGATAIAGFSAPDALRFQGELARFDDAALGLPAGAVLSLRALDPRAAGHRLVLAPLALAARQAESEGANPRETAALSARIMAQAARDALAAAGLEQATPAQIGREKARVAGLRAAAKLYGSPDVQSELAAAEGSIARRLEAKTLAKAGEIAAELRAARPESLDGAGAPHARSDGARASPSGLAPSLREGARADGAALPSPRNPAQPPASAPGAFTRAWTGVKSAVAWLVKQYSDEATPEEVTPAVARFRAFQAADAQAPEAAATRAEIARLRALPSQDARKAYLRAEGEKIMARIALKHGTSNIGFHYAMHGGASESFVRHGILATMGDRITNRNENPFTFDARVKVFFFHWPGETLFDILDANHMNMWPIPSRMGHVLMMFNMDHPTLVEGLATGKIERHTRSSWNMSWAFLELPGVPYDAFLAPPVEVFEKAAARIGFDGRLSRDEQTLAAMRRLEAAALSQTDFVR